MSNMVGIARMTNLFRLFFFWSSRIWFKEFSLLKSQKSASLLYSIFLSFVTPRGGYFPRDFSPFSYLLGRLCNYTAALIMTEKRRAIYIYCFSLIMCRHLNAYSCCTTMGISRWFWHPAMSVFGKRNLRLFCRRNCLWGSKITLRFWGRFLPPVEIR